MLGTKELNNALEDTLNAFIVEIRKQYTLQGHVLTGNLVNSIRWEVEIGDTKLTGKIFTADYGLYVNNGVSSVKIPFSGSGGNGGRSKYIQGLIRFFLVRGLGDQEAKRAAFATAHKHKKEGMPTKNSNKFSKNGKRVGALDDAIKAKQEATFNALEQRIAKTTKLSILNAFKGVKTKR